MTILMFRRSATLKSLVVNSHILARVASFCSRASVIPDKENEKQTTSTNYSTGIHLSPLLNDGRPHYDGFDVELVDDDAWQVLTGIAHAWRGLDEENETISLVNAVDDDSTSFEDDPDFDKIDNMRIRGDLFYKLDRDSKEFEEYSFDFHRRKSSKMRNDEKESEKKEASKRKSDLNESKMRDPSKRGSALVDSKKEKATQNLGSRSKEFNKVMVSESPSSMERSCLESKKVRTPTFNQLTAPYHEPFCLDIYISKASVRACIVHRVTSKVVAVAHSISRDMKFDLGSTRNATACAAVGGILAQRALDDDIHDVVYTPRKGERLEGKLQIVLQGIIDGGVNVKVKLTQRKNKKALYPSTA